ncbi:MAG: ABC transporter ATP-binding protein, partial [Chlorobium sp.]
ATAKQKSQSAPAKSVEKENELSKTTSASKKDKKRIAEVEQKINRLEQRKESLETMMATEDFYKKSQQENTKTLDGYHSLCNELNTLFAEWEKIS